jgi:hypothetical protein
MADNNDYQVIQNGTSWSIIDVASGTSIITFTSRDVADQLAASGDFSAANIEKSIYQDINYQSGVQTQADTSTSNTSGNPTPATTSPVVPATEIQTTTTTSNSTGTPVQITPAIPDSIVNTNSATSGLTPAQLSVLGGADPTDPFIRARLDLPTVGTVQPNLVDAISTNLPSLSNVFPSLSSIQTSIGNTFADIGNLFNSSTTSSIPASDVKSDAIPVGYSKNEYGDLYQTPDLPPVSEVQTAESTITDEPLVEIPGTPASDIQLDAVAQDESNYQQLVQAFSEAEVQTGPSPFAPLASDGETLLVPTSTTDEVPDTSVQFEADGVDPEVVPTLNTDEVPDTSVQFEADGVDPAVDPETGTLPSEVSSGFYDNTPVEVDPNVDPEVGFTDVTYPPGSEEALAAEAVDPEVDPEVGGFFDYPPGSEERDGAQPVPEQEAEDQQLVPIPNPEVDADTINGAPQQPADNDWLAEVARTQAENAIDNEGASPASSAETAASQDASVTQGFLDQARQQQTISNQRKQVNNGDWRVRLRLAPMAKYLYNAASPGVLQPLKTSDGVIFPYTPSIDTVYKAEYDAYTLTHSNYKGYFYKSSYVDAISLKCTFTAQSTGEANYLLAVITFFKAVTKMFYGQDAERGAPPPLTYLSGLGEYQFNEHPCLVQSFNYNLPADVDYIRANSALNVGLNLIGQRDRQTVATASNFGGLNRLAAAALTKGALPTPLPPPTLGTNSPTYVPTKIDISITLLPVQSRSQVSKQFSLKSFANGDLIKGGFW